MYSVAGGKPIEAVGAHPPPSEGLAPVADRDLDLTVDPGFTLGETTVQLVGRGRDGGRLRSVGAQLLLMEVTILAAVSTLVWYLHVARPDDLAVLEVWLAGVLGLFSLWALLVALCAVRRSRPPEAVSGPLPPVTAIVAAYLPNEAPILMETIAAQLREGPEHLQVLVAYNTPERMAIEAELAELAADEPRLTLLRVPDSTSKAHNINAALDHVTGEVVGVFDADHHPAAGSFERAWRWLSNGYDVVQGRCVVRHPGGTRRNSLMTALVATEFETMYAVGHPGRARLHGFGIFAGSNGYWRVDTLRATGFDPAALTEDVDASVRLLNAGGRIASDPGILSTEFAPPSMNALINQRLRWGQGWFQVSRRHLSVLVGNRSSTFRQRLGAGWLFGATVIMPWLAVFGLPFMILNALVSPSSQGSGLMRIFATLGTVSFILHTGIAYRHAVASTRRPLAFGMYVVANLVFYAHLRVALNRLGHVHEMAGRKEWRVTPRF